jgi:hypothetical protein
MYTVCDIVEMGSAQELVLSLIKEEYVMDDSWEQTMQAEEYFEQ